MLYRLFSAVAAVSLLLCITAAVLWVRSYWADDELILHHAMLYSSQGGLGIQIWPKDKGYRLAAFTMNGRTRHGLVWPQKVSVPPTVWQATHAELVLLLLALPIFWGMLLLRHFNRARLLGICHHCGYDLTGNASGICPECGTPILRKIPAEDLPTLP